MELITFIAENLFYAAVTILGFFSAVFLIGGVLYGFKEIIRRYAPKRFWKLTAVIGIPVHELGHLIPAIFFRFRIVDVKFLDLDAKDGQYGYVKYYYAKTIPHIIGNIFVNIGPLILATAITWGLIYANTGDSFTASSVPATLSAFFSSYDTFSFWLFLFIIICVVTHASMSLQDVKNLVYFFTTTVVITWIIYMIYDLAVGETTFYWTLIDWGVNAIYYMVILIPFSLLSLVVVGTWSLANLYWNKERANNFKKLKKDYKVYFMRKRRQLCNLLRIKKRKTIAEMRREYYDKNTQQSNND